MNVDGTIDNTFSIGTGFNSVVYDVKIQTDGKIIVTGIFGTYNNFVRRGILRLNTDGTIDNTFNIGTGLNNGSGRCIRIQSDGKILVGGSFEKYNETFSTGLVRLNTDGSIDNTFIVNNPLQPSGSGFDGTVLSLNIENDGKIIATGSFLSYQRTAAQRIVRLNTDGSRSQSGFGNFNSLVFDSEIQPDGKIFVVGGFGNYVTTTVNTLARSIIRLNSNGTADNTFSSGTGLGLNGDNSGGLAYDIIPQINNKIIMGGTFTSYKGISSGYIVRILNDGTFDTTFNIGTGFNGTVYRISLVGSITPTPTPTVTTTPSITSSVTPTPTPTVTPSSTSLSVTPTPSSTTLYTDILAVGLFTTFNSSSSNRITRLNSDGSIESGFDIGTGFDGSVTSSQLQSDGKILIGGGFRFYNDTNTNYIARLNQNGTIDTSFNIGDAFNGFVRTIHTQPNGNILIGGDFTTYDGTLTNGIIRLNPDGTKDTFFDVGTGLNNSPLIFKTQTNGKILIGGTFTTYNGTSSNYLIRLNSDGSIDNTFNIGTGFNDVVWDIEVLSDGKIIVSGDFTSYSGVTCNRLIRLNTDGTIDNTFNIGTGFNSGVFDVEITSNNMIILGGQFGQYNGTPSNGIIRLNSDGSVDNTLNIGLGFDSTVWGIKVQTDNKIIVFGGFTSYNGTSSNYSIRLNSNGSIDNTFDIGGGFDNDVFDIIFLNSQIQTPTPTPTTMTPTPTPTPSSTPQSYNTITIGGDFTTYSGFSSNGLIRLNTNGTIDGTLVTESGFGGGISTVQKIKQQSDGKLLIGGWFSSYKGATRNKIIRLDINGDIDNSFIIGSGFDNEVFDIDISSDGNIFVGGNFTTYSGFSTNKLIKLKPNGSIDHTFNIGTGFNNIVRVVETQSNGKVLVGGTFTTYNGTTIRRLVRLNADGTIDYSFDIGSGFDGQIRDLKIQSDGKIVLVGGFTLYNLSVSRNRIVRINQNGSIDYTFSVGTGFNSTVLVSELQPDGKLILGGQFTSYNGTARNRIVRLNTDGTIDNTFSVGTGFNATVNELILEPNGKILVGGQFTSYNGTTSNYIIRLNSDGSIDNTFVTGVGADNIIYSISLTNVDVPTVTPTPSSTESVGTLFMFIPNLPTP